MKQMAKWHMSFFSYVCYFDVGTFREKIEQVKNTKMLVTLHQTRDGFEPTFFEFEPVLRVTYKSKPNIILKALGDKLTIEDSIMKLLDDSFSFFINFLFLN